MFWALDKSPHERNGLLTRTMPTNKNVINNYFMLSFSSCSHIVKTHNFLSPIIINTIFPLQSAQRPLEIRNDHQI